MGTPCDPFAPTLDVIGQFWALLGRSWPTQRLSGLHPIPVGSGVHRQTSDRTARTALAPQNKNRGARATEHPEGRSHHSRAYNPFAGKKKGKFRAESEVIRHPQAGGGDPEGASTLARGQLFTRILLRPNGGVGFTTVWPCHSLGGRF